jgi:hypothetical protein
MKTATPFFLLKRAVSSMKIVASFFGVITGSWTFTKATNYKNSLSYKSTQSSLYHTLLEVYMTNKESNLAFLINILRLSIKDVCHLMVDLLF